ncbi:hypothetical protein ACFU9X_38525 [Streptomyces atratus]|uniref:hypothetical protein n=1 Tax=Streptomyces atratus TaxID=1893 RepID=UPI0036CC13E4
MLGEDLNGLGVRTGGGFELEPVGGLEQGVTAPVLPERDGAEERPFLQATGQDRMATVTWVIHSAHGS